MLKTTFVVLSLSLAGVLVGCGEAPIPAQPSFATDVRPIFIARCIRCHGAGGELNADPLVAKAPKPTSSLEYYEDIPGAGFQLGMDRKCVAADPGCRKGANSNRVLINAFVHEMNPAMRMPKPPADPLADWQLEVIARWAANPKP